MVLTHTQTARPALLPPLIAYFFIFHRRTGGEKIYHVFESQLPSALKMLQFDKQLSLENIKKLITEADGYQPHLIAPEQGYRHIIESSLVTIKGPAEASVNAVIQTTKTFLVFQLLVLENKLTFLDFRLISS